MLNEKEKLVKDFMQRRFTPYIDDLFRRRNPDVYAMYQGNFCRQAAVFGSKILEELLPEYTWSAWEANFDDIVNSRKRNYEHAWIYGKHKHSNKGLLVDLSRNYRERLFIAVESNQYPKDHPEYKYMAERHRTEIDINEKMTELEFYTTLPSERLLLKIKKATKIDSFIHKQLMS